MRSSNIRPNYSWFKKLKDRRSPTPIPKKKAEDDRHSAREKFLGSLSPVYRFYSHALQTNPRAFYRFALQSRSVKVRDFYASVASFGRLSYLSLVDEVEQVLQNPAQVDESHARNLLNEHLLLWLADLVANTAQDDLDTHDALLLYDYVFSIYGGETFSHQSQLQYVEALGEAGRYQSIKRVNDHFDLHNTEPLQLELLNIQRIRRATHSADKWLSAINDFYNKIGLSSIGLLSSSDAALLDRLTAHNAPFVEGPKVSVIMPTFSPGPGIQTAIRGLLEQTWTNLEIIIVDDASPYQYADIFAQLEELSPKIRVVRLQENSGAYVARNAGLAVATGDFITTHDDDDWSHPQKIETQTQALLGDTEAIATTSAHIRVTENMDFRRMNIDAKFMQMNYSSLLFRKSILDEIGPWDTVNRGGDSEFLTRITENYGSDRLLKLLDQPLSFSRVWSGSLTSGEMSRGYFANSRLLYRWSFRQWHWHVSKKGQRAIREPGAARPYAVPTTFEPGRRNEDLGTFDVIYVADYFRQAKFVDEVLRELRILSARGLRVGYLHLDSPRTNRSAGILPELFDLQLNGGVTQVSQDDTAETRLLIVADDAIGMFLDRFSSTVQSRRGLIISEQTEPLSGGELRTPTAIRTSLQHLENAFSTNFRVVGVTVNDHNRLLEQVPQSRVLNKEWVWNRSLDDEPGQIRVVEDTPVVGFHSYGNKYRWPTNDDIFRQVYVSSNFKTRIFGHLTPARNKFDDSLLQSVELIHFQSADEKDFLKSIDFWVYFPHYRLRSHIWEPILRALNAGKVVILPKHLQNAYGAAALYCDPHEVSNIVLTYSNAPERYREQAQRGQDFVKKYFTSDHLIKRVEALISQKKPIECDRTM